jgi:hypothetical protein
MLIPLGFLASSGVSAGAFELLESTVLTGSQASVEFTNLTTKYAADYQHLQLRVVARSTVADDADQLQLAINGTSNGTHSLVGTGSTVFGLYYSTDKVMGWISANNGPANAFGVMVLDVLDPFETTKNTTVRSLSGHAQSAAPRIGLQSGALFATNSVTSLAVNARGGNLAQYSRFSLYGIKATA